MEDWSTWLQNVSAGLIDKAAQAKWVQPYEIQRLQLQALGPLGYYREGQPGVMAPNQQSAAGISPTVLLLGGALLVFLMMRD